MTDKELQENWNELLNIYKGILFNNCDFYNGINDKLTYDFACPQYAILKEKYKLKDIAKQGSELEKAIRLLSFFAPQITHKGDFQNNIGCNAISLLDYCLDKPEKGINCLNKSKILQECCLALGTYARRIWLMPYSPFDTENHVVIEIYDFSLKKWVMLDMTSNGYFVNADGVPLSVLEIRHNLAINITCEFIKTASTHEKFFINMQMERLYYKQYFAKNLFYFYVEAHNEFGNNNKRYCFIPKNFDLEKNIKQKSLSNIDIPPIGDISILLNTPE